MNKIIIHTKQVKKRWHCFATINRYDYSFGGNTMPFVQGQMKELLKSLKITDDEVEWKEFEIWDIPSEHFKN